MMDKFSEIARQIGEIVSSKNKQYGDAINSTSVFLKELYPNGIKPEQYGDLGLIIRIHDKLKRIANGNNGNEDAYSDLAGYGILGVDMNNRTKAEMVTVNEPDLTDSPELYAQQYLLKQAVRGANKNLIEKPEWLKNLERTRKDREEAHQKHIQKCIAMGIDPIHARRE